MFNLASPERWVTTPRSKERFTGKVNARHDAVKQDQTAQKALFQTVKLADMKSEDVDAVFHVGGHGPMWDLVESADSIALLESFYNSGKPIALVCHSPGVQRRGLRH
jgi:putative intracellular protease/amidase